LTVSFIKLHVGGDDFILVDRAKAEHAPLARDPSLLPPLAVDLCDRRRGVGGRGTVFVGKPEDGRLPVRLFLRDGEEKTRLRDPLLCAARWAMDAGRSPRERVVFALQEGERSFETVDARSFRTELPCPKSLEDGSTLIPSEGARAKRTILIRGRTATAYCIDLGQNVAAADLQGDRLGIGEAQDRKRHGGEGLLLRTALGEAVPDAQPVVIRTEGPELVRFIASPNGDRLLEAAAAAVAVGSIRARPVSLVAELVGAAVPFAHLDGSSEVGSLIDRGRFYVEWKDNGRIFVTGRAEYSFTGDYDWYR